jgi:hypothetical protein
MERKLDLLIRHLEDEAERQETVVVLCREQMEAARTHDYERLIERTTALEILNRDALSAHGERTRLLADVVRVTGVTVDSENVRLADVAAGMPEPWRSRVMDLRNRIRTATSESAALVRSNSVWFRHALRVMANMRGVVSQFVQTQPGQYDARGLDAASGGLVPAVVDQRG